MDEKVVGKTDFRGDVCGKATFEIVEGSETCRMLQCPECGQYHYAVGRVRCSGCFGVAPGMREVKRAGRSPTLDELHKLLGSREGL